MTSTRLPTAFYSKTWIYKAQAIAFGFLGGFSLIMGPLFLFGVMKPADGRPGTTAGIALTSMSAPMIMIFLLAVFNLAARRRPLIRFYQEGIEINVIGSSSLDGIPLISPLIRIAWLLVSLQGFKKQIVRASWPKIRSVNVTGPAMSHTLTIVAPLIQTFESQFGQTVIYANQIVFPEVAFVESLQVVADTIITYQTSSELTKSLETWD